MDVYLETLGCQMNRLDSELIVGLLRRAGHSFVDSPRKADAIFYNTCSVREHAEQKIHSRLGADAQRKTAAASEGRTLVVGVLGCMVQREGDALRKRHPVVDVLCSPGQIYQLPAMLAAAADSQGPQTALDPDRKSPPDARARAAMDAVDLSRDPRGTASKSQAFVRVMRGCDKFCTYCVVPHVRGPERSRGPAEIEAEVRNLLEAGISEVTLLGQTVNSYRHEAEGATTDFAALLRRIGALPGLRRLRFVTSHPVDFSIDILEAMRDTPAVCPYLHIPAQSGSDRMLAAMNRKYSRREYDDLVDAAREIVPNVVIVSDFIVGFPGETEADHAASADLIRRSGYKNSFIFKYSPRPGTAAAERLTDDVPDDVKKRRNNELLAVQKEVGLAHHQHYVGRNVEVLVTGGSRMAEAEGADPETRRQLMGRTRGDHIVIFQGPPELADRYVTVHITDASDLTLFGERNVE